MKTLTREQTHVELMHKLYDAFSRGDIQTILNNLDPKVEWQEFTPVLKLRGMRRGPQQVAQFFQALASEEETLRFTPRKFMADGDTVVVLGDFRSRVRQNGKELEATFVHVIQFNGEKLSSFKIYNEADRVIEAYS